MSRSHAAFSAALLVLTLANSARADDDAEFPVVPDAVSPATAQVIYKGVIGNMLDTLPMDPVQRVDLQRANAVVSNTISGRSLATLIGLSNPILMIGGLVWGLWSASNIQPVAVETDATLDPVEAGIRAETQEPVVVYEDSPLAEKKPVADLTARTASLALDAFAGPATIPTAPSPIIRVWLSRSLSDASR